MSSVLVSLEAGVLQLTLNRPDKLNAFNPEMHKRLRAALEPAPAALSAPARISRSATLGRTPRRSTCP